MNKNSKALGEENIGKLLKRLSIPAMMGMIVNALYNFVDTVFLGQFVGVDAIGALAISFPIQMIIMGLGTMIGIGAASAASRALGAKQIEKADHIVGNAFLSIFIIGILLITLGREFLNPILTLFGATDTLLPLAYDYMNIILMGSIFLTISMVSNNVIRAEGNAKVAMISMMIGTGFNIILDPIFIELLGFGIEGAAIATVLGQVLAFLYVTNYFYRGKSNFKIMPHHLKPNFEYLKEIFTVGFPTFMRQIAGSILAIVVNNSLGFYGGDLAISVYGVINRVLMFILMPMFGIVQGFQPIASFNYGAKNFKRVIEVLKVSIKFLIIYSTIGVIIIQLFPGIIIKMFNNDTELVNLGKVAIRIVTIMIPFVGIQILSASLFQAIGKAGPALIVSMSRQTLFLIPLVLLLPNFNNLGVIGIYAAFPIADVLAIILSLYLLRREVISLKSKHLAIKSETIN
ncbi:MAG TPA: MATE family efflux transporter [Clostridia bacterium]|nr:MATE family efflux transporter [Clostridia bacterium]